MVLLCFNTTLVYIEVHKNVVSIMFCHPPRQVFIKPSNNFFSRHIFYNTDFDKIVKMKMKTSFSSTSWPVDTSIFSPYPFGNKATAAIRATMSLLSNRRARALGDSPVLFDLC